MKGRSASRKCQHFICLCQGTCWLTFFTSTPFTSSRQEVTTPGKESCWCPLFLLTFSGDIQRPRIHLQTQRVAVDREGGCLGKEKSRFACCKGTAASVAPVSTGRWGSVCCCCPFCRKGDNAVSGEGTELRAAVALGRGVGAWLS